jgi:hypothetical protein
MGAITRSIANNITTGGVFTSSAITNNSVTGITVLPNAEDGITLISSQTASSSASISFTSGLTSTYKAYKFVFSNIHSQNDNVNFRVNFRDGGSLYDAIKTTTFFIARHEEDDSAAFLAYETGFDLAQSTGVQTITGGTMGSDNDQQYSGCMYLFNPSSTTYVKHFIIQGNNTHAANISQQMFVAGYCNVTAAIDGVQFDMDSGNIDAGTIYMYGIK